MKKIEIYEPWFFLFFGVFHLHRIWGMLDRTAYAEFWIAVLEEKGAFYDLLMGILLLFCVLGIGTFCKYRRNNYWWRWVYVFGGGYLLFDILAIAAGLEFWHEIIGKMFDTSSPYWNVVWTGFILLGGFAFGLGIKLLYMRRQDRD